MSIRSYPDNDYPRWAGVMLLLLFIASFVALIFAPELGATILRIWYGVVVAGIFVLIVVAGRYRRMPTAMQWFLVVWLLWAVGHVILPTAPLFFSSFQHANTIPLSGQMFF